MCAYLLTCLLLRVLSTSSSSGHSYMLTFSSNSLIFFRLYHRSRPLISLSLSVLISHSHFFRSVSLSLALLNLFSRAILAHRTPPLVIPWFTFSSYCFLSRPSLLHPPCIPPLAQEKKRKESEERGSLVAFATSISKGTKKKEMSKPFATNHTKTKRRQTTNNEHEETHNIPMKRTP